MANGADLVLHSGAIWTVGERVPEAEALAISDGRILAIGTSAEMLALAGARTRKIDLGKKRVTPGFYDAHAHPVLSGVDHLRNVACDKDSIDAVQKELRARAAKTPAGKPVLGFLYDDGKTPQPLSRWDLDKAAPDHPVIVTHRGGHTMFVNSLALKMAGITDSSPQPKYGQYFHDANGKLNGRIADHGLDAFETLAAYEPSRDDFRQGTALISKMFAGWQIGVHANGDLAIDRVLTVFERLQKESPRRDPRFRIEHCTLLNAALIRRIRAVGAIPIPFAGYV